MVSRMHAVARFLLLLLVVSAPLALAGAYFVDWDWMGAVAGFVLADVLLILAALTSERVFITACRGVKQDRRKAPASLEMTLRRTHEELVNEEAFKYSLPRVLVYPDPLPNALTVRSVGSAGTILLSQGLMASLSEPELRAVLRESIRRNDSPEWLFNSLCASLATHTLRAFPGAWREFLFSGRGAGSRMTGLGAVSLLPVLWTLPWTRFFLSLCGTIPVLEPSTGSASIPLATAMRKTGLAAAKAGHNPLPGAAPLFLVEPGPAERLL